MEELRQKLYKVKYAGYKGINLEKLKIEQLKSLNQLYFIASKRLEYATIERELANLPKLSLEEIRNKAIEFCQKYFNIHDINYISMQNIQEILSKFFTDDTPDEICKTIDSSIEMINPFDLKVDLVYGHSLSGQIKKIIPVANGLEISPNRKMIFTNIELGNQLTPLSVGTLVHEVAHAEQEHNLGYAEDYLNREVISMFLEKVVAYEMDSTGYLLKLSERIRFNDILVRYNNLINRFNTLNELDRIDNLMYIKSLLNAEKLFDLYLAENKQKKRDRYFYGVQDVFDGKITVEEMLSNRNVTTANSQDFLMLKRHL